MFSLSTKERICYVLCTSNLYTYTNGLYVLDGKSDPLSNVQRMLSIPGSALGVTGLTAPLLATAVLLCVLSIGLVVVSMPLHFSFSFSNDSKLASACSRSISNLFIFCCRAFSAFNTAEGSIQLSSVLEGP